MGIWLYHEVNTTIRLNNTLFVVYLLRIKVYEAFFNIGIEKIAPI